MATATERDQYAALVIMDPRLADTEGLWAAQSSYTQATPRPGVPEPAGAYQGTLRARGSSTGDAHVRIAEAGLPGTEGAQFLTTEDTGEEWMGWEGPAQTSHWESLTWSATASDYRQQPTIAVSPNKAVVIASKKGSPAGTQGIVVEHKAASATTWTSVTVFEEAGRPAFHPCLLNVGSRLVLFFVVADPVSAKGYIHTYVSDDDGASWSIAAAPAARDAGTVYGLTTSEIQRVRGAYTRGQIILLVETWDGGAGVPSVVHFASQDMGATLHRVETISGIFGLSIVGIDGVFVAMAATTGLNVKTYRIASAFQSMAVAYATLANEGIGSTYAIDQVGQKSAHGFALAADDTGAIWAWVVAYTIDPDVHQYRGQVAVSYDLGASWVTWGQDVASGDGYSYSGRWWGPNDATGGGTPTNVAPREYQAVFHQGRALMAHRFNGPTTTYDNSLCLLHLGGWTELAMPRCNRIARYEDAATWDLTWLPFEEPENMTAEYTESLAGAATSVHTSPYLTLASSALASTRYYTFDDPGATVRNDVGDCAALDVAFYVPTGGDVSTERGSVKLRVDDGVYGYEVVIRQSATAIRIVDGVSGSQLASASGLTDGPRQFRLAIDGSTGKARVFWRPWEASDARRWTSLAGELTLTDDGGTVGNHRLQFGIFVGPSSGSLQYRHYWHGVSFGDKSAVSNVGSRFQWWDWDRSTDSPSGHTGRRLPAPPSGAYATSGVEVSGLDGPFLLGQTWAIEQTADYPAARVLPHVNRSPRLGWRSQADGVEESLAFQLGDVSDAAADSLPIGAVSALILRGVNWRTGELQAYRSGAWVKVCDLDNGMSEMEFTRTGNTITPNGNASAYPMLAAGELSGFIAHTRTTSGPVLSARRRVRFNTEGRWSNTYSGPKCRCILDGVASGDPASGNVSFIATDVAYVFPHTGNAAGWRIVIDSQTTIDGYYTVGQVLIGPVHLLAHPYSWGRRVVQQLGSQVVEQDDRTTYLKRMAPKRRIVEMTWADGLDETQFWDTTPDPDYLDYDDGSSGEPVSTPSATLRTLGGLVAEADGQLVAYLPRIDHPITATTTYHRREQLIVGRASGETSIDTIQGEENNDEVVRSQTFAITEEV